MHSPQPFPSGSAPVAVQSRPVSNRTYSAEIPRLDRCRHSSSAATSRIIAYQKRSHARISVPYQNPFCKLFCVIFRTFFGIFSLRHILCRPAAAPTKYRPRWGHTIILYRAGWRLLSPAGGVFVKKSVTTSGGASLIKGLISTPARRGLTFVRAKGCKNGSGLRPKNPVAPLPEGIKAHKTPLPGSRGAVVTIPPGSSARPLPILPRRCGRPAAFLPAICGRAS